MGASKSVRHFTKTATAASINQQEIHHDFDQRSGGPAKHPTVRQGGTGLPSGQGAADHTRATLVQTTAPGLLYRASKYDCDVCHLKPRCCPKEPVRKVPRSLFEGARDMARHIGQSDAGRASRRQRKKVEILFAHLKRILRLDRLRLRGPNGARDEFLLAATVQNLRKLAKLVPEPTPAGAS